MNLIAPDFGLIFWIILSLLIIVALLIALIDLLRHDFSDNNKIVWAIVIIFIPLMGPILYSLTGRKHRIK